MVSLLGTRKAERTWNEWTKLKEPETSRKEKLNEWTKLNLTFPSWESGLIDLAQSSLPLSALRIQLLDDKRGGWRCWSMPTHRPAVRWGGHCPQQRWQLKLQRNVWSEAAAPVPIWIWVPAGLWQTQVEREAGPSAVGRLDLWGGPPLRPPPSLPPPPDSSVSGNKTMSTKTQERSSVQY